MEPRRFLSSQWLLANHLIVSSKKGISAHQLHRTLGVTYKTAWVHGPSHPRSHDADRQRSHGRRRGDVEVDETYYGKNKAAPKSRMAIRNMNRIVSLVERNTGRATSIVFNGSFAQDDVKTFLFERLDRKARLLTDEAHVYKPVGQHYRAHGSVNHFKGEYVSRTDPTNHTNTIEGFFGIFKRGMRGIYQHCGQQHLARYLAEFDFRYTNRSGLGINDTERADIALKGIAGKRLTYRRIGGTRRRPIGQSCPATLENAANAGRAGDKPLRGLAFVPALCSTRIGPARRSNAEPGLSSTTVEGWSVISTPKCI